MNKDKRQETGEKTYLPPLYSKLVAAQSKYTGMSKSAVIADSVRKCFDAMPVQEREKLLDIGRNRY
jgi:hypothetical protein